MHRTCAMSVVRMSDAKIFFFGELSKLRQLKDVNNLLFCLKDEYA